MPYPSNNPTVIRAHAQAPTAGYRKPRLHLVVDVGGEHRYQVYGMLNDGNTVLLDSQPGSLGFCLNAFLDNTE